MKRYRVKIGDRVYLIEIGDLNQSPIPVRVDGRQLEVIWEPEAGPASAASLQPAGPSEPASVPPPGPAHQSLNQPSLVAPMPGTILEIHVSASEQVSHGQVLCVLEAMKMKNNIRSPRDGVIAGVGITEGQAVAYGDTLFEFE